MRDVETLFTPPQRGEIMNKETGESRPFPLNPEFVKLGRGANYSAVSTFASSQALQRFKDSVVDPFELDFHVSVPIIARETNDLQAAKEKADDFMRFLLSLTLPSMESIQTGYVGAEPPLLEVSWPSLFRRRCKASKVDLEFKTFFQDGSLRTYRALCQFVEVRDNRLWSEDLLNLGLMV